MAANNYYGFTHGGTQYTGTGGAQSYQTNQAYGQGYSAPAGRGTSGAYDAYQPNHTASAATYTYPPREAGSAGPGAGQSYEYGYARSSTTFEGAKSYYQGHNAATPKGPAAKNPAAYGGAAQNPGPRHAAPKAAQPYGYGNQYAGNKNYDASLYGATNSYMQGNANGGRGRGKWGPGFKKGPGGPPGGPKVIAVGPGPQTKPKPLPKQPQIHYCDVCKISCAGPQTFKEHLEGQKHKKKDAANKLADTASPAVAAVVKPPPNSLRCELCDVACTGADAYAAHIRGVKHQKVVKLHTKLGKVIPPSDPVPIVPAAPKEVARPTINPAPKITFTSQSIAEKSVEMDPESSDVHPVGQEFIEEVVLEGKPTSFQCKLCDCRFNDPNAKEMHMKGRKHRLQYKRKVNPELVVDPKPNSRQKRLNELKQIRSNIKEEMWLKRQGDLKLMDEEERIYWDERRRFEEDLEYLEWYRRYGQDSRAGPPPRPLGSSMMVMRRPSTADDRHVSAKHTQIYPSNEELQTVQKIVSNTEKALKLVSDEFAEADGPKVKEETTPAVKSETKEVDKDDSTKDDTSGDNQRFLKGVMRVGVLAKGLLLRGDIHVQLVILCSDKPTKTLLNRVANSLPKHLIAVAADEKYDIKKWVEKAAIVVSSTVDPKVTVTVTLTSPLTRETPEGHTDKDPRDLLDKQKCLEALAALRHAKWFQAKAAGLQSCVMITRILRDLCQRIPTWTPLNSWAMELLAEKVISSAGQPLSPGDALRRILEAVASGVLLPEGPGLLDPCEKDPLDATVGMTKQEREDITASAQHALRLIAFRQIHKVLGMDALPPPPKPQWGKFTRKRRRDNSTSETVEQGDGKKDKKDVEDSMETEVPTEAKA